MAGEDFGFLEECEDFGKTKPRINLGLNGNYFGTFREANFGTGNCPKCEDTTLDQATRSGKNVQ